MSKEKQISKQYPYRGKVVNIRVDEAQLEDGTIVLREVVEHPGGVCIALEDENHKYTLVSQWRYAQEMELLEFPAGKLELDENPMDAIIRETKEETGYEPNNLEEMGIFVPTGAYGQEKVYLYYAKQGEYVGQHLDEDESIDLYHYSLDEIIEKIMRGEIIDGKTCTLAFKLKERK